LRALAIAALAASLLAGCGSGIIADAPSSIRPAKSEFTSTQPHDFPLHGIDVSKYQGDIDWQAVRRGGVAFAYIKATEGGNHIDAKFQANWEGARAAGLPRGAYHFVWWCRPPMEEIKWFESVVPAEPDALPPVLDVEATPTSRTCKRRLDRESALRDMRVMLTEMERHYGKKPVIYTTVDFYEAILSHDELSDYPIWIRSTKYSPHVRYGSRKWHFWQYQSDGVVPGIRTNVDRNAFHGDRNAWLAFASGYAGPSQAPTPRSIPDTAVATTVDHPSITNGAPVTASAVPTTVVGANEPVLAPMALMPPAGVPEAPFPPRR
jgi:lysozyme